MEDPGAQAATIDTLLLLALPASGKSEIRRYLGSLPTTDAAAIHLGPLVDLDDYPYVHLMRRISEELVALGADPVLFPGPDHPFCDPYDWITLIELLNEDHRAVSAREAAPGHHSPAGFLDRLSAARAVAGAGSDLDDLDAEARRALESALSGDVAALVPAEPRPPGGTIVMEFARGGPDGASPPLDPPLGYQHALARLDPAILAVASILYVAVDPADSRRRNQERSRTGRDDDASILFHGVPEEVMRHDYGCDDLQWLVEQSAVPGTVTVDHPSGAVFHVPTAVFDNRDDRTSFLRDDESTWPAAALEELRRSLGHAFAELALRRPPP